LPGIEVESLKSSLFLSDPIELNSVLRKDFLKELKLDISSDFNDFELAGIVSNVSWKS
jgi:hypothetical protein